MAELDNLSINITASTRSAEASIDNLIEKLTKLNEAFSGLSEVSAYTNSMEQIASSMRSMGEALSTLDITHVKGVASSMKSLATAGSNLSSVGANIQGLNSAISQTSNNNPFSNLVSGLQSLQNIKIGDFSNITTLANGVNKLGYQSASTAAQLLPQIANGLRDFNFRFPDMTGMESFANGIRSLGSKAVQRAAYSLPFVADGLRQLSSVQIPDMKNLSEFASTLSVFGRKTSTVAVTNIPKLTSAFQQLFTAMSKAPTISRNTIDAANAMANLASRTGSVSTALNRATPSLNLWSKSASNSAKHTFSLAAAIGKVYATYWMLFRAFGLIRKSINIASDLTEVRNVVVHAFDDMAYKANEFAESAGDLFGMSKLQALDAASRYQAMGKTMSITDDMVVKANDRLRDSLSDTLSIDYVEKAYGDLGNTAADMSLNLTKLAGDLASLYNTDIEVAAEKLNSIFTGTTKPLREFGFDLTQATLQEWALTNGIDANVKSMTQAEKAVLRYQYVMANAGFVLGDFVRTADSWHNMIVRLKMAFQNLGSVIGQGFINLLKPAIQKITAFVNTLTGLIQKALNAIGKLLGWQVEIDPVAPMDESLGGSSDTADDIADAMEDTEDAAGGTAKNMDKSAKAAKKMKDYLLGIDELNVFRPDEDTDSGKNKSGSGSGSNGGAGNGGATGGKVTWENYESDINSWFGLGRAVNKALKEALQGIDWDGIQSKWAKFGHGFASFLNGFNQDATTFWWAGKTVAEALNTIATGFESFFKWFNGFKFGIDLGNIINGFVENIDWTTIKNAAHLMAEDLAQIINGAVGTVKWDLVGSTIAESLNTAIEFALTLGTNIKWKSIGTAFAKTINGFFSKFNFTGLAKALNAWANGLLDAIITALEKTKWSMIGTKIGQFIAEIDFTKLLGKAIKAIWLAINGLIKSYSSLFDAAPIETALGTITLVFGGFVGSVIKIAQNSQFVGALGSIATHFRSMGTALSTTLNSGFSAFVTSMINGNGVVNSLALGFNNIASALGPMVTVLGSAATAIAEFFMVKDAVYDLVTGTGNLATNITELVAAVGVASVAFSALLGFPAGLIAAGITAAIAGFVALHKAVSEEIDTSVWNTVGDAMSKPGGTPIEEIATKYDNAFADITEGFDNISVKAEGLNTLKTGMKEASDSINLVAFAFENGATVTDEKIDEITQSFNRLLTDSKSVFNQEYDVILAGLAGSLGDALAQMGIQVPEIIGMLDQVRGTHELEIQKIEDKMAELKTAYANGEIDATQYGQGLLEQAQKYKEITGETDEYTKAVEGLGTTISSVDMSGLVTELNGVKQVDTAKLATDFDKLKESYKLASETIDSSSAGMVTALSDYRTEAERTKNSEAVKLFNDMMTANAQDADAAKRQMEKDLKDYGNLVQKGIVDDIPGVIDQALQDYDKRSPLFKLNTSEADYVGTAMSEYKTNVIDKACAELQKLYVDTLGHEVNLYAQDAAEEIAEGLYDESVYYDVSRRGQPRVEKTLNDNIDELIKNSTAHAKEKAKDIPAGIDEGASNYQFTWYDYDLLKAFEKGLQTTFDMHSPAKAMNPYGENIMLGLIQGFKNKFGEINKSISEWYEKNVKPWFTPDKWKGLGANMGTSIISKWNEFRTQWTTSVSNWWNSNVKTWFTLDKWKTEADHIREAIKNRWDATASQWITDIASWWNQHVLEWFKLSRWKTEADHIRDAIISKFADMVSEWASKISAWWTQHVVKWFDLNRWKELANNIKTAILGAIDDTMKDWGGKIQKLIDSFADVFKESKFKEIGKKAIDAVVDGFKSLDIANALSSWATGVKDWLKNLFTIKPTVETNQTQQTTSTTPSKKTSKKASGGVFDSGRWHNIHAYGTGGAPLEGELFWAREKGPELVGQIGGNTAVMNNDQIVSSVAAGVQQAVTEALAPYLSDISQNTRVTANKDFTVQIGDRQIAEANNRGQRAIGAVLFS